MNGYEFFTRFVVMCKMIEKTRIFYYKKIYKKRYLAVLLLEGILKQTIIFIINYLLPADFAGMKFSKNVNKSFIFLSLSK